MTKMVNKKLVKGFSFIPTFSHAGRIHAVSGISASSNKIHILFNFHPSDHVELSTCLSDPRFAKNLDEMFTIGLQDLKDGVNHIKFTAKITQKSSL